MHSARDRLAYFQRLYAGCWHPGWRVFWESQVDHYAALLADAPPPPRPRFRADNEAAWAAVFDALGVAWKYEALEPDISRAIRYMPDFWLPDQLAWVEIKSALPAPGEVRAARDLLAATGRRVYVLAGWPGRGRFSVWLFAEAGEVATRRPDWAAVALCNLFDCGFGELEGAFEAARGE